MPNRDIGDRVTLLVAGITTVTGGLAAIVVNALHPSPPARTDELLTLVGSMPHWMIIHYVAAFAAAAIVAGFALLLRTLHDPWARGLGDLGKSVTALGAAAFVVAIVIDGYGYPRFAGQWMAASGDEKAVILWAATALHIVDTALFPVWSGMFMGLGLVLVAVALWRSGDFPRALAAFGMLGGSMCFVFALSHMGSFTVPLPLWPLGPAINGLWITALGAFTLRRGLRSR